MSNRKKEARDNIRNMPINVSLKVSATYILLGTAWILLSDIIVFKSIENRELISNISIFKGLVYVLITGLIIYGLTIFYLKKVKAAETKMWDSYEEIKAASDELATTKEFNSYIIEKMLNAFALHKIILDESGNPCDYEYVDVNPAFEEFTGIKGKELIGKSYKAIISNREGEKTDWVKIYGEVAVTGKSIQIVEYTSAFDKWVVVNAYSPQKYYFVTVFNDITHLKKAEEDLRDKNEEITSLYEELVASDEELRQQYDELTLAQEKLKKQYRELDAYQKLIHHTAYHDQLTGLPNRLSLFEKMEEDFASKKDNPAALLFIDSDNLKMINDTMGHSFGDQLIISIGEIISSLTDGNLLYRLGGDGFVVYCNNFRDLSDVLAIAENIIQRFSNTIKVSDSIIHTTVSVGVAFYPEHGQTPEELLQSADIAMHKAKTTGKNKHVLYDLDMKKLVIERMSIERNLYHALARNEFLLYYQPQINLSNGKISGYEALLRWNSPELGFLPPMKFIGVAEETQMIVSIGEWVLHEACSFIRELHRKGYEDLRIAVNISILQLIQENFVDMVISILKKTGLRAECLELEITESILMESFSTVTEKLCRLKNDGVRIALDDFGRGYSSLSYLEQLPIHTLKIDKSFIDSIIEKDAENNLTGIIIVIGDKMGLKILAEGVESREQLDYLIKHKCQQVQGYYFSKPLPHKEAIRFFEKNRDGLSV